MLGPHEGREWALMMAGEKDIAFFSGDLGQDDYVMPEEFLACVDNRHARIGYVQAPDAFCHVFYQRGCEAKAEKFVQVLELARRHYHDTDDYEIEIGRLLGYSEEDIAFYIRHLSTRQNSSLD
ncbi:MAG: hypothetical protein Q4D61_08475 [Cardiobacteriaceae bacterium]|nr:hypothetical protein [Cardiobacteriaceae bacterium]